MMNKRRFDQIAVFSLTWLAYAALYLTRKNFSVVKSDLHDSGISVTALGMIDTCYLSVYALGQFFSGMIGDRIGARRVIAFGLLGSACASFAMGYVHNVVFFAVLFGVNGIFQSTGWSNNVKALEPWFPEDHRGKVLGLWGTCQQVGGIVATVFAAFMLAHFGWQWSFFGPAPIVFLMGIVIFIFLARNGDNEIGAFSEVAPKCPDYSEMLKNPWLWCIALSYFALKMIRYSLLFWLPFYLHQALHIESSTAGYLSVTFEVGGIAGSVIVGWLADRYFKSERIKLMLPMISMLTLVFYFYREFAAQSLIINCLLLCLIGILVCGPDVLMSGTCAQDIGGRELTGSAAGFINGIGSVGAMLQGLVTAYVSSIWGWSTVFYLFFILASISGLLLIPFLIKPRVEIPQQLSS